MCTNVLQIHPLDSITILGERKRRKKMSFLSFPHAKTKTSLRHVVKCQWEIWNVNLKIKVSDELKSSIDLLLVSDCVYYEQSLQPLVKVSSELHESSPSFQNVQIAGDNYGKPHPSKIYRPALLRTETRKRFSHLISSRFDSFASFDRTQLQLYETSLESWTL